MNELPKIIPEGIYPLDTLIDGGHYELDGSQQRVGKYLVEITNDGKTIEIPLALPMHVSMEGTVSRVPERRR